MIDAYIKVTGNVTLLERALPLAEQELTWWSTNRTINVTSPYTGAVHSVYNFNVTNSAPRPEGYVEDFSTAFDASPALNQSQRETLFAELASGAETGWDYSSRWCKAPLQSNISDNNPALRTLNTRAVVPVDLNALLAGDHALVSRQMGARGSQHRYLTHTNSSPTCTSSGKIRPPQPRRKAQERGPPTRPPPCRTTAKSPRTSLMRSSICSGTPPSPGST
jgi:alpha,alpha-trehalase